MNYVRQEEIHAAEPLVSDPSLFEDETADLFRSREVIRRAIWIKCRRSWSRPKLKLLLLRSVNRLGLFLQPTLMHNSITHICHITILDMFRALTLHRLRADCSLLSTGVVYSRLGERGYHMLCLCSCSSWGWACQGPKHVEDSNVTYMCYWIVH